MNAVLRALQEALGDDVALDPAELDLTRHLKDFGTPDFQDGAAVQAVVLARSTEQVATAIRLCAEAGVAVVPQGGMSGLSGGGVPVGPCVVLSLERMREIEELDPAAQTITVQAGVVLETIQKAAEERGFFFPLDLGGRGSAQAGGLASTNAGGNRVLRYGMMRDLILGVEVVLPDGSVVTTLNKMIKNNAGYDLKQLFIGAEGTLGVITRLVLRLYPAPTATCTGLASCADYAAVLELLDVCRRGFGASLSAFECMWSDFYTLGTKGCGRAPALPLGQGCYVLIETQGADAATDMAQFEAVIGRALENGAVQDAVIAGSLRETANLWAIRDTPGDYAQVGFDPSVNFDISLPVGRIGAYTNQCKTKIEERWPGAASVFFGHVADSNLHIGVAPLTDAMPAKAVKELIYALTGEFGGSISAEHGIGIDKRDYLHYSRNPAEVALMRRVKAALDPAGLMNPGKVF